MKLSKLQREGLRNLKADLAAQLYAADYESRYDGPGETMNVEVLMVKAFAAWCRLGLQILRLIPDGRDYIGTDRDGLESFLREHLGE